MRSNANLSRAYFSVLYSGLPLSPSFPTSGLCRSLLALDYRREVLFLSRNFKLGLLSRFRATPAQVDIRFSCNLYILTSPSFIIVSRPLVFVVVVAGRMAGDTALVQLMECCRRRKGFFGLCSVRAVCLPPSFPPFALIESLLIVFVDRRGGKKALVRTRA